MKRGRSFIPISATQTRGHLTYNRAVLWKKITLSSAGYLPSPARSLTFTIVRFFQSKRA